MVTAADAATAGIRFYRRHISPHKGFHCAHAAYFGGPSCSEVILAVVQTRGVLGGWRDIATRFAACRSAHARLRVLGGARVRGLCCCGPLPIPFRCG